MATTKRLLQALSEIAKQDKERHENRLSITAPLRNELKTHYQLSMMPELKEKRTKMKAQTKAEEDSAYAQYLLENPKLLERIVLEEFAKEELKKKEQNKMPPKQITLPQAIATASPLRVIRKVQITKPAEPAQQARNAKAEKDEEAEDDDEAEEYTAIDVKQFAKPVISTAVLSSEEKKVADSLTDHYIRDERITNDYSQNMALLRTLKSEIPLAVRQASAISLTEKVAQIKGEAPQKVPPRVALKLGVGPT